MNRWVRNSKKQPEKEIQKKAIISYQNLLQEPSNLESALKQIQQLKEIIGKKELEIEVLSELLKKRMQYNPKNRNGEEFHRLRIQRIRSI